nr:MAG TPA: hypothetical protein [Caudoviricetes sp.]
MRLKHNKASFYILYLIFLFLWRAVCENSTLFFI